MGRVKWSHLCPTFHLFHRFIFFYTLSRAGGCTVKKRAISNHFFFQHFFPPSPTCVTSGLEKHIWIGIVLISAKIVQVLLVGFSFRCWIRCNLLRDWFDCYALVFHGRFSVCFLTAYCDMAIFFYEYCVNCSLFSLIEFYHCSCWLVDMQLWEKKNEMHHDVLILIQQIPFERLFIFI